MQGNSENDRAADFALELSSFILKNFLHEISDLYVILPKFFDVVTLQEEIIKQQKFSLLPRIYSLESSYRENLQQSSNIEQQLILSKFLQNGKKSQGVPQNETLKLIQQASDLLHEIETIKENPDSKFDEIRESAQEYLNKTLEQRHLIGSAHSYKEFIENLLDDSSKPGKKLIIAGFRQQQIDNDKNLQKLYAKASSNKIIFYPPEIGELKKSIKKNNIVSIKFEDKYQEASYISDVIKGNLDKKIALACNDAANKQFFTEFLRSKNLVDYNGYNLEKSPAGTLAISLAKFICAPFSAAKLITLLGNPLLQNRNYHRLHALLISKNRFVSSWAQLKNITKNMMQKYMIGS